MVSLHELLSPFTTEHLRRILVVHANILIYAFSYWLTQPILPFLSKDLGADPILFGYLQTTISLLQLFGGPLVGRLSDVKGPRMALIMSQVGSTLTYTFLGVASNVTMLFVGQLPTLLMHAMHAAQAAMTLLSTEEERAKSLGRLSLSYGVGMVLGSYLGGSLGKSFGNSFVAFLAAGISFLSIPMNLMFLPALHASSSSIAENKTSGEQKANVEKGLGWKMLEEPLIRHLLIVQSLFGLGLSIYQKSFSQAMQLQFHLNSSEIGKFMAFSALVALVGNSFIVGWLTARYSERTVAQLAILGVGACLLMYSQASTVTQLAVSVVPLSISSSIAYTVFSSTMTKAVPKRDSATSLGLSHASRTFNGVIAPTLAGYLYQDLGFHSVGYTAALLTFVGVVYFSLIIPSSVPVNSDQKKKKKN